MTLVVLLVIACGAASATWLSRHHQGSALAPPAPVTSGPVPAAAPTASVSDPFLGSPAAAYADNAAGIVVPAAHATGSYSAAQVRAAYRTTKNLLIAANLNRRTLRGGSPAAFARLLVPRERTYFVRHLDKLGADRHGTPRSTRAYIASFAPGSASFAGTIIKVHGQMSAASVRSGTQRTRVLQVHASYVFVYPVLQPGQPGCLMRVVAQVAVNVDFGHWDDASGPLQPWWGGPGEEFAGALCGINDGFIHPDYPNSAQKVRPSGPPVNPYASPSPVARRGCQATLPT